MTLSLSRQCGPQKNLVSPSDDFEAIKNGIILVVRLLNNNFPVYFFKAIHIFATDCFKDFMRELQLIWSTLF